MPSPGWDDAIAENTLYEDDAVADAAEDRLAVVCAIDGSASMSIMLSRANRDAVADHILCLQASGVEDSGLVS